MKYSGRRARGTGDPLVFKEKYALRLGPSLRVVNHSPTGFNWGYGGSGPAQLALGLLLDVTGDKDLADRLHQNFKWEKVAKFEDEWEITSEEIQAWIDAQNANQS